MAPPGGAILPASRRDVIDLISDDDDEDVSQISNPVPGRNNFLPPTVVIPPIQTSNSFAFNGLPDPDEFPHKNNTQSSSAGAMGRSGSRHGLVSLGSSRQSSAHPNPRVNGLRKRTAMDQVTDTQPSMPHGDKNTIGSHGANVMNASRKRRKLGDEVPKPVLPQIRRISSGPILPPPRTGSPRLSSGGQASTTTSVSRSIITGKDRAEASFMPPPMEPEMKRVLETQVLPHVHAAVRPYRETLTYDERTGIGQDAASKLVTVPGFMAHYLMNNKTLTPAFEGQIKVKAYMFVNQGVAMVVAQRLEEEDPTYEFHNPKNNPSGFVSRSVNTSENGSTPPSEESEQPSLLRKRRRAISVSPSTSYSNDQTDAETGKQSAQHTDMSRSRRAAAQLPQGTYGSKKRARRSRAEMEAIRAREDASRDKRVPIQHTQEFKPKRPRRTKAQMAEARFQEDASRQIGGRQRPQKGAFYQQTSTPGSHSGFQDELIGPALARGNVARAQVQNSLAQPSLFSTPISASSTGDSLKPYIRNATRKKLGEQLSLLKLVDGVSQFEIDLIKSTNFHVPFSPEELTLLRQFLVDEHDMSVGWRQLDTTDQIVKFVKSDKVPISKILKTLEYPKRIQQKSRLLGTRSIAAIAEFLADALVKDSNTLSQPPAAVKRQKKPDNLMALLRDREGWGLTPGRTRQGRSTFKAVANNYLEDALIRQSEWTDCSGDISSITWTGSNSFICGALAHSDNHNMQYNKPGNLMVGSISLDTVKSYPDHRVVRPLVEDEGEKENANALDSMRTTQSPWMYESVVSTAFCEQNGFSFTASFDKTVKVWLIGDTGSEMTLQGTWQHDEKVNFVAASPHHERIATACATNGNAVRVYDFDSDAISRSPYKEYCGDRSAEATDELGTLAKWSYQPATMQWGKAPGVVDFLLVGYSPRSTTGNDNDVPELKRNSGEICLWNTRNQDQILIISAKTQNVFEVIWHPTQPIFLAATSPHGPCDMSRTRTQVRIFHQQDTGTFSNAKTLDCPAIDINELTVKANSHVECFVTASCTNGTTYVWDTARSDQACHILEHGESLDNPDPDVPLDVGDSGVKFAAWGKSADRFYTGGSDGVIKAWDFRSASGNAFVRDVMCISGGISTGVFNEDCSRLLIGDATGKIYLLSIDDSDIKEDIKPSALSTMPRLAVGSQMSRNIQRPKIVIPHSEPAPPAGYILETAEKTGPEIAQEYLATGRIARGQDPYNFAYQGPNYRQMNRFNKEAHVDGDLDQELLPEVWAIQQCVINGQRELPVHTRLPLVTSSDAAQHQNNLEKNKENFQSKTRFEWDPAKMSSELWALLDNGKQLELAEDVDYEYQYEPGTSFAMFDSWKRDLKTIQQADDDGLLSGTDESDGPFYDCDDSLLPMESTGSPFFSGSDA